MACVPMDPQTEKLLGRKQPRLPKVDHKAPTLQDRNHRGGRQKAEHSRRGLNQPIVKIDQGHDAHVPKFLQDLVAQLEKRQEAELRPKRHGSKLIFLPADLEAQERAEGLGDGKKANRCP